jgi:hypothetical protein
VFRELDIHTVYQKTIPEHFGKHPEMCHGMPRHAGLYPSPPEGRVSRGEIR